MATVKYCVYCGKHYTNADNNTYGDTKTATLGVFDNYICDECCLITGRKCLDCGVVLWSGISSQHPHLCNLCFKFKKFTCEACNKPFSTKPYNTNATFILDKDNKVHAYHDVCVHKVHQQAQLNNTSFMDHCSFCGYNMYHDARCVVEYVTKQSFATYGMAAEANSRAFCPGCVKSVFYDTFSSLWTANKYKYQIAETITGVPVYIHEKYLLFPAPNDRYIVCTECGEYHLFLIRITGLCIKCTFKPKVTINNYSFKPTPIFFKAPGEDTPGLFFGVENEISFTSADREYKEEVIERLSAKHFWYFKTDSSIVNGYECVTHPGSLKYWQTCAAEDFKQMFNNLSIRTHSSCGLHIHMPKDAFTNAHLFKFGFFITNEIEFFSKLAGRKPNSYCCLDSTDAIIKKAVDKKGTAGRYTAVNTKPEHTVEVRLFSGKISFSAMLHDVECLAALYDFTQKARVADITKDKFIEFVVSNTERYPTLIKNSLFKLQ